MPFDGTLYEDEILRVLRAAQERIRLPENWCKKVLARTISGHETMPSAPAAVQYCARGALEAEAGIHNLEAGRLLHKAASKMGYRDDDKSVVVILNDTTDHSTVMAMFSRAIELRFQEMTENVLAAR